MDYPGNLYAVAAPSGAGKSTLVKALLELDSHLSLSISHTTRKPRGQDQHGREYHFVDEPTFRCMVERGEFVEWAEVHGHLYGTSRAGIEERIAGGHDVLLEIDWQGALQIKRLYPNAVLIFILPPSWDELRLRLERRGEDDAEPVDVADAPRDAIRHLGRAGGPPTHQIAQITDRQRRRMVGHAGPKADEMRGQRATVLAPADDDDVIRADRAAELLGDRVNDRIR